ncbi:unnamed protein product [Coffea canephora]|uniref:Pentatricopeptide repeat-containing protein n=1 Tax=Coffea canephora TaxID=49390 RepID=A0A068VI81_COFCA|nr:unnamed protein product [Coffea canephora]
MLVEKSLPAVQINTRALQQHLFSLLQNCKTIKHLSQIHTQVIINGFSQTNFILVNLLSFYITSGNLKSASQVFEQVQSPSTNVWNQIIRGHGRSEKPCKSVELFNLMGKSEALPDGYSYSYVINGCTKGGLLSEGRMVHGKVWKHGFCSNVFVQTNLLNLYSSCGGEDGVSNAQYVFDEMGKRSIVTWNSLLSGFFRCGDVDGARRIFDEMPERNVVSWTTMIDGCLGNGRCGQALALFHQMRRAQVEPDQVTLVVLLSACAELGDLNLGRWIHRYSFEILSDGKQPKLLSLNNALIHMYASCGVTNDAYRVFKEMPQKTTVSWTSMITGFAKQGYAKEALKLFHEMDRLRESNVKPDEMTFLGVLSACSHTGHVDQGWRYFCSMSQTWGVEPRVEHYGCMVDVLSRAGLLDEAVELVRTMPMKPNDVVWGALLGGCRIYKNVELASHVDKMLDMELEPDRAAGYCMLLSDVYSTARRWQEAHTVKQKIVEMGVRKPSGRSWVQINGVLHDFVVNDRAHKHSHLIYDMLGLIRKEMNLHGY